MQLGVFSVIPTSDVNERELERKEGEKMRKEEEDIWRMFCNDYNCLCLAFPCPLCLKTREFLFPHFLSQILILGFECTLPIERWKKENSKWQYTLIKFCIISPSFMPIQKNFSTEINTNVSIHVLSLKIVISMDWMSKTYSLAEFF